MTTYRLLSYHLEKQDPGWPGTYTMELEQRSAIVEGEIANTFKISMLNHFGSHMDGPKHFNDKGPRLAEMPLETFIYEQPLLIDIPKSFAELVTEEELKQHEKQIKAADLLMIRTGFSKERKRNKRRYAEESPGVSLQACKYLMDVHPQLKAVALDWISLGSYAHLEEGHLAHQYLLGHFHQHYICIIEELNFEGVDAAKLKKVIAMPLFLESIDSAPVTVLAEIN